MKNEYNFRRGNSVQITFCTPSENGSALNGKNFLSRVDTFKEASRCSGKKQETKKVVSLVKIGRNKLPGVSKPLNNYNIYKLGKGA